MSDRTSDPRPTDADPSFVDGVFRAWCDAPAFPHSVGREHPPGGGEARQLSGLSRREYVAARALQGALANPELTGDDAGKDDEHGGDGNRGDDADRLGARAAEVALAAAEALLRRIHAGELREERAALEHSERP